jgi:hypothetical protein
MPGECRSLTEAVTISTPATLRRLPLPDRWGHAVTFWAAPPSPTQLRDRSPRNNENESRGVEYAKSLPPKR